MKPTVGRIVLYTGDVYPQEQQAAIITKARTVLHRYGCRQDGNARVGECETCGSEESAYAVSLRVFYETGDFFMVDVPFSETFKKGHWTWPPRV